MMGRPCSRLLPVLSVIAFVLTAPWIARAQEPDVTEKGPGDESVRVTVRGTDERAFPEITLDFEVRQTDGTAILDARREDFRVTESAKQVEVLSFLAPTSKEIRPTTVVLVVDRSRSMILEEDRMTPLKKAVRTFLEVMPDGSRVGVIAFSSDVKRACPLTEETEAVRAAVDALEAGGGTRFYDAVSEAIRLIAPEPGRRAILALTDGEDTFSQEATLPSAIALAREAGVPVHTLGVGTEEAIASDALRLLAEETRGKYFNARQADQLRGIYEEVARSLRESYSLTYRSDRRLPDGTLRPVAIYYGKSQEAAGEAEVFIRGMVVPAAGWSRLFAALVAGVAALSLVAGLLSRKSAASRG